MKRNIVFLVALMVGMCQTVPTYASEVLETTPIESGIVPLYEHVRSISTVIEEDDGVVSCGVAVTLQESGRIEITMKLQRRTATGWTTIRTWSDSKTGSKFNYTESTSLSDTSELRVQSTTKVTADGVSETITQTDEL